MRLFCYIFYYFFARHLPVSYKPYALGAKIIRYWACKHLFRKCGKNVNVEHGADVGSGKYIEIGDHSGIGVNCVVKRAIIGSHVMIGPDVMFINQNHNFSDINQLLHEQGYKESPPITVEDNVWIGARVIILPGKRIGKNSILGAGSVITKDVPDNAIVAGNPAKVIRYRNDPTN